MYFKGTKKDQKVEKFYEKVSDRWEICYAVVPD